ncbi:MAG TPA: bifunctional phosphopantothenoylcysteine decarboxylase/phosphopantothenate--cysteine ligase CoaBC [Candidatus Dormibacteraeota bacterium]
MPIDPAPVAALLRGRRLLVCVAGGIAAYKVADLVSQLTQAGVDVRVAMTSSARRFVGPATFHGLSGRPVATDLFAPEGSPEPHVELGDWAQLILVAPATANLIARIASGESADLVSATILAARCPVVVAPAMNDAMWAKPVVQQNLVKLLEDGITIVDPESGRLASGHSGAGRLASAEAIFSALETVWRETHDLAGRRVVVSAGGTREPIDPVRFISNYSSGKMGFAFAEAAADRGAQVSLVTSAQHADHAGVTKIAVETAQDMLAALQRETVGADLLVMAAAVADYRPAETYEKKVKREGRERLVLELEQNPDLLAELSHQPGAEATFKLGFAAEDADLQERAEEKVRRKGLDAIVANDISRKDIAFGSDYNAGFLIFRTGERHEFARITKRALADQVLDLVKDRLR